MLNVKRGIEAGGTQASSDGPQRSGGVPGSYFPSNQFLAM